MLKNYRKTSLSDNNSLHQKLAYFVIEELIV